jgi:hypothetical protein
VRHSFIDGIQLCINNSLEDVDNISVGGKLKRAGRRGEADKRMDGDLDRLLDDDQQMSLQIGDVLKIRPHVRDEFDNETLARHGSLNLVITTPSGSENIMVVPQQIRGVWQHDVSYELQTKGRHKLDILMDDVPIVGSPVEWLVKQFRVSMPGA